MSRQKLVGNYFIETYEDYLNKPKKAGIRIRHAVPSYKKVYSVYQFDWFKYAKIWKQIQILSYKYDKNIHFRTNPYRVLQLCYVRDENNELIPMGDEKHVYRYQTFHKIIEEIYNVLIHKYDLLPCADVFKYLYKRTGIVIWQKEHQAELTEIRNRNVKERILAHITLLRCLKLGLEVEDACKLTQKSIKHRQAISEFSLK